jgi:hypothetical protein
MFHDAPTEVLEREHRCIEKVEIAVLAAGLAAESR